MKLYMHHALQSSGLAAGLLLMSMSKKRDVMRVLKKPAAQLSCQSLIAMIATAVYSDMTCQIWKHGNVF